MINSGFSIDQTSSFGSTGGVRQSSTQGKAISLSAQRCVTRGSPEGSAKDAVRNALRIQGL